MPLFENQTPETIRSRILSKLGTDLQTREGSFLYDVVSPISFEIWRQLMTLDELIDAFYVNEASGKYLDAHAQLLALQRRPGTKATVRISFTCQPDALIDLNMIWLTEDGLQYKTSGMLLAGSAGRGVVDAVAVDVGEKYNVEAGAICKLQKNNPQIYSFSAGAATGGTDPESDEALYERIDYRRKHPSTSGNENHYREWALACNGVGGAKVEPRWDGPGTVRVLIAGYDWGGVDADVVTQCAEYIETQRPVCAEVTVISAQQTSVDVTATVAISGATTLAEVQELFAEQLSEYLQEISQDYFKTSETYEYLVRYNRIAAILMGISGVIDYTELKVNGAVDDVSIAETNVPVVGEVTLA